jgi:hypothetical protein
MEGILKLTRSIRIPNIVSNKNRLGRHFTHVRDAREDLAELLDAIVDVNRFATKDVEDG